MITINQEPDTYVPAYNEIVYVVDSDHKTDANFKYVADLYIGGDVIRLKQQPHPTFGSAAFNFGRIVETYVTADISLANTDGFSQNTNSFRSIFVRFGEEYGLSTSGTTVYPNQAQSSTSYAWNGVLDFLQFKDFEDAPLSYVFNPSVAASELTNAPNTQKVQENGHAWLHLMSNTSGSIYCAKVETYDSAGALIDTIKIKNPYEALGSVNDRFVRFNAGTKNMNQINSSGVITGTFPIDFEPVDKYAVSFERVNGTAASAKRYYKIDRSCTRNTIFQFHFLNQLGGFDSFAFIRGHQRSSDIKRSNFKKNVGGLTSASSYGYSRSDVSTASYFTEMKDSIKVKSDWIDEETCTWLEELVTSPRVFLHDPTHGLVSVTIVASKHDFKQDDKDKLFNLEIEFQYSYNRYRQRE